MDFRFLPMTRENIKTKGKNESTLLLPCRQTNNSSVPPLGSVFFTVENKPFRIYTAFFIGSKEKLVKELKRKENLDIKELELDDEKTFSGITIPCNTTGGHSFILIWLPSFNWTIEDFETLSHECLHAAIMVMRMSGVRSKIFLAETDDTCDDEGICYSQSSMFGSILSELVKRQSKVFKTAITAQKSKKN